MDPAQLAIELAAIKHRRDIATFRLIETIKHHLHGCPRCHQKSFRCAVVYLTEKDGGLPHILDGYCSSCGYDWMRTRYKLEQDELSGEFATRAPSQELPAWKIMRSCSFCKAILLVGFFRADRCTGGLCHGCLRTVGFPPIIQARYHQQYERYRRLIRQLNDREAELCQLLMQP